MLYSRITGKGDEDQLNGHLDRTTTVLLMFSLGPHYVHSLWDDGVPSCKEPSQLMMLLTCQICLSSLALRRINLAVCRRATLRTCILIIQVIEVSFQSSLNHRKSNTELWELVLGILLVPNIFPNITYGMRQSNHHHHHHHHQCSAQGQVLHWKLRYQGSNFAQRQVFHCKLRNLGCSFTRDE